MTQNKIAAPHLQRWVVAAFNRHAVNITSGALLTIKSQSGDIMTVSKSAKRPNIVVMSIWLNDTEGSDNVQTLRIDLNTSEKVWYLDTLTANTHTPPPPADNTPYTQEEWLKQLAQLLLYRGFGASEVVDVIYPSNNWFVYLIQKIMYRWS